jgi:hypothetical protein
VTPKPGTRASLNPFVPVPVLAVVFVSTATPAHPHHTTHQKAAAPKNSLTRTWHQGMLLRARKVGRLHLGVLSCLVHVEFCILGVQ